MYGEVLLGCRSTRQWSAKHAPLARRGLGDQRPTHKIFAGFKRNAAYTRSFGCGAPRKRIEVKLFVNRRGCRSGGGHHTFNRGRVCGCVSTRVRGWPSGKSLKIKVCHY